MTRTAETIFLVIWFEYANHFDQPLFEYQKVLQTYYISILFELSALNFLSIILRQFISAKLASKKHHLNGWCFLPVWAFGMWM